VSDPRSDDAQAKADSIDERLAALQNEIGRLRELVVRVYDDTPRGTVELLKARRRTDYRGAYGTSPLVTVRIGAYAGGDTLFDRAIASVRRQTYARWEAIIVCDGRDEETATRISSIGDPRIRCVERPRNGPYPEDPRARWLVAGAHPFNQGFALGEGAWIAPLDQDDEWSDDHLEALVGAAQASEAEVVYGVARVVVGEHGETYFGAWPPTRGDFGFQSAIQHAGLSAFLYDANAYLLDEPADWNLARRMLEAGVRFEFLDRIVATYYVKPDDAPGVAWWRERIHERGRHGG
jgi:glycosyltransferase involved in cell wall biosynthesis